MWPLKPTFPQLILRVPLLCPNVMKLGNPIRFHIFFLVLDSLHSPNMSYECQGCVLDVYVIPWSSFNCILQLTRTVTIFCGLSFIDQEVFESRKSSPKQASPKKHWERASISCSSYTQRKLKPRFAYLIFSTTVWTKQCIYKRHTSSMVWFSIF